MARLTFLRSVNCDSYYILTTPQIEESIKLEKVSKLKEKSLKAKPLCRHYSIISHLTATARLPYSELSEVTL